ncbi:MAG: hypothetical protein K2H28_09250 [Ruminococcus sp.]|nr:hypothetical protein [Ruminococcus sp.]
MEKCFDLIVLFSSMLNNFGQVLGDKVTFSRANRDEFSVERKKKTTVCKSNVNDEKNSATRYDNGTIVCTHSTKKPKK